ncbi:hypothetical protein EI545_20290 [Tabrizicola piscis]|uniref:Uncharacterized protein n=2 Tax=Tabrizicola piscis TaxID=2494374 RepID=A0A3S8UBV8_9RHOB|nr:hypothetical protein EI545_20290 [Tabrizicola piscis]
MGEAAMVWVKWGVLALGALVALWAVLALYGGWRWQQRTAALVADLTAARLPLTGRYDPASLAGLPPPVQRYFRAALTPGQPLVTGVSLHHQGTFNMGEGADNWKHFTSDQTVETARPGFVWDGTIRMAPGLPVRVHDAYVAGEGVLVPALFGLVKLTELRGTGDIAEGELLRWLAEAAWYPTALLPGQGVEWTALDDHSALATLTDGTVIARLTFRFGPDDLIASVRAEARGRTVEGAIIPTPWEGHWSDYRRHNGMMVPMAGEVAWMLPEGPKPYWRGWITGLDYRFAG